MLRVRRVAGAGVGVVRAALIGAVLRGIGLCVLDDGDGLRSADPEVQPAIRASAANAPTAHRTDPACHATPMRMRGWADGVSHRMIDTRLLCGIATQPAVAEPTETCRKNALPAP